MRRETRGRDEEGMALVIAILVLLVLTLLGVIMLASSSVSRQVAGQSQFMRKALDNAEAGVGEAIMRIRSGDAGMVETNPRSTAQVFLAPAGSLPAVGPDTVAMATAQPAGQWLAYSTATTTPDVLTITYKTDPGRTVIYRYDRAENPAVQTVSGVPIYRITSTGHAGEASRTVITEVISTPITLDIRGCLTAGMDVDFVGNAVVCGFNHEADTPAGTGEDGRLANPSCVPYESSIGDLPGTWSTGSILNGGAAYQSGWPVNNLPNQTGFYAGPWQMLGMSQSEFITFIGTPQASATSLNGLVYMDNDLVLGNQSGSAAFHGVSGEGMLYVDGDLTLNSGFVYVGIVYVEGDLLLNGQAWILGALVVRGQASVLMNGGATILYSSEAIKQKLGRYGGQFTTLSWREK